MHFPKSAPELIERFHDLAPAVPPVTSGHLFGYPAVLIGGNMFAALHGENLILRLPEGQRLDFIDQTGGDIFEPSPGRRMKEYVVVPPALLDTAEVSHWLDLARQYAAALPPKAPKFNQGEFNVT
jgi:hypothetical protein